MVAETVERENTVGRRSKDYKTKQVRVDEQTHDLLNGLAGLEKCDIPDWCSQHLAPILEEIYRKRLDELHREVFGKKKGK